MVTINTLGFKNIIKGMKFSTKKSIDIDYYEIISDLLYNISGYGFNTKVIYKNNFMSYTIFMTEDEINNNCYDLELIPEELEIKVVPVIEKTCYHFNVKKVILVNTSGYFYCPDCKKDLGDLSEEEFRQAVKEQYGGPVCKRGPDFGKRFKKSRNVK
jgi:hypothetical protein